MEPIVVDVDILSIFIDYLTLNPLPRGISDIDPLADGQFPPLELERRDILDKIMI